MLAAAEIGSYNPSPGSSVARRGAVLPRRRATGLRRPGVAPARGAPRQHNAVFAQTCRTRRSRRRPSGRGERLAQSRRRTKAARRGRVASAPARARREPVCGGGRVAESSFEDARAGRRRRLRGFRGARARGARRAAAVLVQLAGEERRVRPFVIDPERARRPANPTPARALSAQREARRRDFQNRRAARAKSASASAAPAEEDAGGAAVSGRDAREREPLAAGAAREARRAFRGVGRAPTNTCIRRARSTNRRGPRPGVAAHVVVLRRAQGVAAPCPPPPAAEEDAPYHRPRRGRRAPVAARGGGLGGPSDGGGPAGAGADAASPPVPR